MVKVNVKKHHHENFAVVVAGGLESVTSPREIMLKKCIAVISLVLIYVVKCNMHPGEELVDFRTL